MGCRTWLHAWVPLAMLAMPSAYSMVHTPTQIPLTSCRTQLLYLGCATLTSMLPEAAAKESRFGDPVDPPVGAGRTDVGATGATTAAAESLEQIEAQLAEAAGGSAMLATVKKKGKVVLDVPTAAGGSSGPPKLADTIHDFVTKLGAPPEPAVAAARFAAEVYGVYTAHDLKDAAPILCKETGDIDPEDCWGFLADIMNDANGAHQIQGGLRYLQAEYDEKGYERPWGTLTLEEVREKCLEKHTCLTDDELAEIREARRAAAADAAEAESGEPDAESGEPAKDEL